MANFVLVHGAWHGGWCWQRVLGPLAHAGHRVYAPTLTGLGERAHLLTAQIDLQTHVQDVQQLMECEELQDVILVGHSYAGMIITALADRMSERMKHLVYVDAVVPQPGESWSSTHASATREARVQAIDRDPLRRLPPPDPAIFGLTEDDYEWVRRRQTPQPGGTYEAALVFDVQRVGAIAHTFVSCTSPALATIDASRQRVVDPQFWQGHWLLGARVVDLATGHDPMITQPHELVQVLLGCAH
jgi:pimeloyl-ACP methyl ester carboxylesterase